MNSVLGLGPGSLARVLVEAKTLSSGTLSSVSEIKELPFHMGVIKTSPDDPTWENRSQIDPVGQFLHHSWQ